MPQISSTTRRYRRQELVRLIFENLESRSMLASDFGDAPDTGLGVGFANYETLLANGGPSHNIDATFNTLFLGTRVDGEADAAPSSHASNDDQFTSPGRDDEDGLLVGTEHLSFAISSAPQVRLKATNLTGSPATLYGWIDVNRDGLFDNGTERASIEVPDGANQGGFTLAFPVIDPSTQAGATYARFRLSSDSAAAHPNGAALDGEVEDYQVAIHKFGIFIAEPSLTRKIAHQTNGGPTLNNSDEFGSALAAIGDLDGDGITDQAVGASGDDTGGSDRGAVYVQRLNSDGTVKSTTKLASDLNGIPTLGNFSEFGGGLASIGDFDGDGIGDLAIGATSDSTTVSFSGAVYIVTMNADGTAKGTLKITGGINGGPTLSAFDYFGGSIASLGDLDGDGVTDLAVGSRGDDTGGSYRGAVSILFLNSNGSVKNFIKLGSGLNGGPTLVNSDKFGIAVTGLGDLDGDGIVDLAVGASGDDTGSTNRGAVYVLLLNANGTVKSSTKIASELNGGPLLNIGNEFGGSLATIGDFGGDGLVDIAVGATGDSSSAGAVYYLGLNADGTVNGRTRIGNNSNGGPALTFSDRFGSDIASLGDINGDGFPDFAVAAYGDDTGGSSRGASYVLYMTGDNFVPYVSSILRQSPLVNLTNADALTFRVSFTDQVFHVDASDFVVTGTTASISAIAQVSRSIYDVTLTGGDLSSLNGVVGLNMAAAPSIVDRGNNLLDTFPPTTVETYTLENIAPSLLAIVRSIPISSTTSASALRFRATFSEPVLNVDASDFAVSGSTAGIVAQAVSNSIYDLTVSGGDLADLVGVVGVDLAIGHNIVDLAGNMLPFTEPAVDETYSLYTSTLDFGDAPDTGIGTGFGNYRSTFADNGPRHTIVPGLKLGNYVDDEQDAQASDDGPVVFPDVDDGDGLLSSVLLAGMAPTFRLLATNSTGNPATLYGWIDIDRNGVFDNVLERASVIIPDGALNQVVSMTFSTLALNTVPGPMQSRFRLSTDSAGSDSYGPASDGEVEDHVLVVEHISDSTADPTKNRKIADATNGGPSLVNSDHFGSAVARIGDFDGDGIHDQVVGADDDDTGFSSAGAIYLQLLNANGTVKSQVKLASNTNGGPTLGTNHRFGSSIAAIGDLNGDGIADIAVGARNDGSGVLNGGAVHILLMNANGTIQSTTKIASGLNGGPVLNSGDAFGRSLTSLGDFDGDGVVDLAVGAYSDDTSGTNRGAVYLLLLNDNGSVKNSVKIASGLNGGPTLVNDDQFGFSIASLGDLDGDGIRDLAVGARNDDTEWSNAGAIYVVFMNGNGTVKNSVKIASQTNGGPDLSLFHEFGSSVAALGDLDGDQLTDLAVGAPGDFSTGVVHLLRLSASGTVKHSTRIGYNANGGPSTLQFSDDFGSSVAAIGDLDQDGVTELAVGAIGDDAGGTERGAVHILYLKPDTAGLPIASFRRQVPSNFSTNADSLVFRAQFSEDVFNVDAIDFIVNGTTATITDVVAVNAGQYDITISGGNLATLNGNVDLNLLSTHNIRDRLGFLLPTTQPSTDDIFFVDNLAPTTVSFQRWIPSTNLTSADGLRFRATFSESVMNVDATDFMVSGTTAMLALTQVSTTTFDLTLSGGDLASLVGSVGIDFQPVQNITDLAGNSLPTIEPAIDETFSMVTSTLDFGDAPDLTNGTGVGNYRTRLADDGPRHTVVASLKMGANIDVEPDASFADDGPTVTPDRDDEDGLVDIERDLTFVTGAIPKVRVRATNLSGSTATLYGWIDVNRDGVFDNASERAMTTVLNGANNVVHSLTFPQVSAGISTGKTYMRFRLSTDAAAANATGAASDGEVEDHLVNLVAPSSLTVDGLKTRKIAHNLNGGPSLSLYDSFGASIASIGDLDGDGIGDLAVGATGDDYWNSNAGSIRVLLMNANGTVKSQTRISGLSNGGPSSLTFGDYFGSALAAIGDLDGDGIPELAVGARGNDSPSSESGAVYILFMRANGTAKTSVKIASGQNGAPTISAASRFGSSIAALGDFDGDGINDIVVGAYRDSLGGTERGAIYMLMLNANGTVKNSQKIGHGSIVPLALSNSDRFGHSVASVGDLNGDGVTDIAVGVPNSDLAGADGGAIYVLLMNSNRTVNSLQIINAASPAFLLTPLFPADRLGSSLSSPGDLNGDGFRDLISGARLSNFGATDAGAIYLLLMNSNGSSNAAVPIASGINNGPTLVANDQFGNAVAAIGDHDGDGVVDFVVGADRDNTGGIDRGAIYILYSKPDTNQPNVVSFRRQTPTTQETNADVIVFRATFNEDVLNVSPEDFVVVGGSTAVVSSVISVSDSVYHITVSSGDLSSFTGAVGLNLAPGFNIIDRSNNLLGSQEPSTDETFTIVADASVVNRQLFYNRSTSTLFGDGTGNPINAIDTSKSALLPGQTASFANYSNYTRGLNGLVIDVIGLAATPVVSDFAFAVWNGIDAGGFVATSAIPTITFLPGVGLNNADRIKIEFADNAIHNTWLRISALATVNTGLPADDVFYFGNAIADFDVGNSGSPTTVRINATDTSAVRQNQSPGLNSVGVTNVHDLNKDGRVNATDTSAVRQNQAASLIRYFTAPIQLQMALATSDQNSVLKEPESSVIDGTTAAWLFEAKSASLWGSDFVATTLESNKNPVRRQVSTRIQSSDIGSIDPSFGWALNLSRPIRFPNRSVESPTSSGESLVRPVSIDDFDRFFAKLGREEGMQLNGAVAVV